ncbi:hypothetical protein HCN44_007519 [Aphidius gifuensis]|uniref:Centriolar and ciliogenesis-associated protein HYLS1 C-terminal domain-containing protein n=1 Tax=Aphidius gifuensis TaxID=684658 RepID=A0A835CPF2_APHGI|nr:hypothetical protein HCN44_007519 [Aphidius gifuensis]
MSEVKDDPRQVLGLLNSLGFVGITAKQLQAFMKDLKLYRKMKERERQLWKEEVKQKILLKQCESARSVVDTISNESSKIKIEIKCLPEKQNNHIKTIKNDENKIIQTSRLVRSQSPRKKMPKNNDQIDNKVPKNSVENIKQVLKDPVRVVVPPLRVNSEPELRKKTNCHTPTNEVASEPTARPVSSRNPSRSSTRSQSKSFIRSWNINSDQRAPLTAKTDPVALYQKYQKAWKQMPLPGENHHADIRWAVREKMMAVDPIPRPILKKTMSSMSVRQK